MNDKNIVSPEDVHKLVAIFVDDFINRRIFLKEDLVNRKDPNAIFDNYGKFGKMLRDKYFDPAIIGTERAGIEKDLFNYIVAFTTFNLVLPSKFSSIPEIEKRLDKIEQKLDSNNKLLTSILTILHNATKDDDET